LFILVIGMSQWWSSSSAASWLVFIQYSLQVIQWRYIRRPSFPHGRPLSASHAALNGRRVVLWYWPGAGTASLPTVRTSQAVRHTRQQGAWRSHEAISWTDHQQTTVTCWTVYSQSPGTMVSVTVRS